MTHQLQSTLLDLSHFSAANYTAVYKILKKHDKQTGLCTLPSVLEQLTREPFHDPGKARLEKLQRELREFADQLGVDSDLQMKSPHDKSAKENILALVRISFSLGVISMALVVLAVLSGMEPQINHFSVEDLAATIPVLRLSFMMNLTAWLAGGCAYVFERCKINYMFLLDISPDLDVSAISLLNYASAQTGVWIVLTFCFLADMKFGAVLFNLHPEIHKLGWSLAHIYSIGALILQLTITSRWVSLGARRIFSRLLLRVFCFSLLGEVSFAENIFADFLTSLARPLKDAAYTVCYFRNWRSYQVRDIRVQCKQDKGLAWAALQCVLILPLLFRIAQCLRRMHDTGDRTRHLLNCGKYSLAIIVSLLAAVHVLPHWLTSFQFNVVRVLSYLSATFYAATWDLVVDFGLLVQNRRCLYSGYAYPVMAGLDVALRSTWLLTYQPDCRAFVGASTFNRECFAFMISCLELIRRAIWATLRIEHEHQSNAGRFRSVCWVPPLEHRRPMTAKSAGESRRGLSPSASSFSGKGLKRREPSLVALIADGAPAASTPCAASALAEPFAVELHENHRDRRLRGSATPEAARHAVTEDPMHRSHPRARSRLPVRSDARRGCEP